jgi:hypothetical protein
MNEETMLRVEVRRRVTAFGLAVVLAVLSSATCLVGAEASQSEMACGAAMSHDSGDMSVDKDCCALVPASPPGVLGTLTSLLTSPPVIVNLMAPQDLAAGVLEVAFVESGLPKLSSRPTYLFV